MSVGIIAAAAVVVSTGASIVAGKKRQKAQQKAAQEQAYFEGAAPIIPASNELAIETIGDAGTPEGAAPDFREALEGTYGGDMYDTESFDRTPEQIPPELEALLMQQQMSGPEPTNVQFSRTGGPVGLPQDVYHFSVPKISQMQMDVDPGVRNVGNAMMAQMEANPGMGMVSASAADNDQMAAGGPVQPKKYQDGSEGGITPQGTLTPSGYASNTPRITEYEDPSEVDPQVREYLELQNSLSGLGTELLHTITTPETPIEQSINTIRGLFNNFNEDPDLRGTIFNSTDAARQRMLGREELSQEERRDLYFQDMEEAEAKQEREENLRAFIEMQRDKRRATGGPVQPPRYEDGSTGGIKAGIKQGLIETVKNQTPGLAQVEILKAIEMTNDPEEKRRLARQLIPGMGFAEMGLGGLRKIGSRIRERRANRQEEAPVLGPQMSD